MSPAVIPQGSFSHCLATGNSREEATPIMASRNATAVCRHPKPYFTLRAKSMDEASAE